MAEHFIIANSNNPDDIVARLTIDPTITTGWHEDENRSAPKIVIPWKYDLVNVGRADANWALIDPADTGFGFVDIDQNTNRSLESNGKVAVEQAANAGYLFQIRINKDDPSPAFVGRCVFLLPTNGMCPVDIFVEGDASLKIKETTGWYEYDPKDLTVSGTYPDENGGGPLGFYASSGRLAVLSSELYSSDYAKKLTVGGLYVPFETVFGSLGLSCEFSPSEDSTDVTVGFFGKGSWDEPEYPDIETGGAITGKFFVRRPKYSGERSGTLRISPSINNLFPTCTVPFEMERIDPSLQTRGFEENVRDATSGFFCNETVLNFAVRDYLPNEISADFRGNDFKLTYYHPNPHGTTFGIITNYSSEDLQKINVFQIEIRDVSDSGWTSEETGKAVIGGIVSELGKINSAVVFPREGGTRRIEINTTGFVGTMELSVPDFATETHTDSEIILTFPENEGSSVRADTLGVFFTPENGEMMRYAVCLRQEAYVFSVSPASLAFPAEGGTQNVTVSADEALGVISVSTSESWLSATSSGAVSAEANPTTSLRSGTITFSAENGGTATVSVTQEGLSGRRGTLTVSGNGLSRTVSISQEPTGTTSTQASIDAAPSALSFSNTGGKSTVALAGFNAGTLSVSSDSSSWLSGEISPDGETLSVSVAENFAGDDAREGKLTVSSSSGASVEIPVEQAAGGAATLSVSPSSLSFGKSGGTADVSVSTNATGWTASVSGNAAVSVQTVSSTLLRVVCAARTDTLEDEKTATVTVSVGSLSAQISVAQAGEAWEGTVPDGNGPNGGDAAVGDPVIFPDGKRIVWRGTNDYFEAKSGVSGGVSSDGGESWTVTLKMKRAAVEKFIKSRKLFIGSLWKPVKIPTRNRPPISGWDVDYDGGIGTVKIKYELKADTSYSSSRLVGDEENLPIETTTKTFSTATIERSLSECEAIFGKQKFEHNSRVVKFAEKLVAAESTYKEGESKEDRDNRISTVMKWIEISGDVDPKSKEFNDVCSMLRNGQMSFLDPTSTFTMEETRNSAQTASKNVGKYTNPPGQSGLWLLTEDSVTENGNGSTTRRRTWQKAEIEVPTYEHA